MFLFLSVNFVIGCVPFTHGLVCKYLAPDRMCKTVEGHSTGVTFGMVSPSLLGTYNIYNFVENVK